MMTFWERLESLLQKKQISASMLANTLGLSNATMTQWKNRGTIPNGEIACSLAKFFNVDVEWLIMGETKNYSKDVLDLAEKISKLPSRYFDLVNYTVNEYLDIIKNQNTIFIKEDSDK